MSLENIATYIQKIDKEILISQTKTLVQKERELTAKTLLLFCEIEKRMIHLEMGYPSLNDFLVSYLGFSEGCASRRVASVRLMSQLPDVESKIVSGELTLTNIAAAQRFFNSEAKHQAPLKLEEKKEVLESLIRKSTRQAEKELIQRSSVPLVLQVPDQVKVKGPEHVEIRFLAPQELADLLEEARGLLAHRLPAHASMSDVILALTEMGLERIKKERFGVGARARKSVSKTVSQTSPQTASGSLTRPENQTTTQPVFGKGGATAKAKDNHLCADIEPTLEESLESLIDISRYIDAETRRAVFLRAGGRCEYLDLVTERRCNSTRYLEIDHCKTPFARGGKNTIDQLQLTCRHHNVLRAVQDFGPVQMKPYLRI